VNAQALQAQAHAKAIQAQVQAQALQAQAHVQALQMAQQQGGQPSLFMQTPIQPAQNSIQTPPPALTQMFAHPQTQPVGLPQHTANTTPTFTQ
jgi:hypothetical protein